LELSNAFKTAIADRYDVVTELAEGPTAAVFLANEVRHRRRVALKVLRPDASVALSDVRFVREIKMLAQLQHPGILSLYDSGHAAGLLFYVTPYVPGETLRARMARDGRLRVRDAILIACQLGSAVDYAHRHGVVHRDIKPENILLSDAHALLMDFGIARAIGLAGGEQLTAPHSVGPGTPPYMSPEQFIPGHELDGRTDIYSLATVVFEMLSGELPFRADGGRSSIMRKLSDPAPRLRSVRPDVPAGIDAAVARALAAAPSDRYGSAVEFANALEAGAGIATRGFSSLPDDSAGAARGSLRGLGRVGYRLGALVLLLVLVGLALRFVLTR
jgi:serine/threonine-protein kinase